MNGWMDVWMYGLMDDTNWILNSETHLNSMRPNHVTSNRMKSIFIRYRMNLVLKMSFMYVHVYVHERFIKIVSKAPAR